MKIIPETFIIEDGLAYIRAHTNGWLRKCDMAYCLMRTKELKERQLQSYNKETDLEEYNHTKGMIDMLTILINELNSDEK